MSIFVSTCRGPQFYDNIIVFSMAQLKKTGAAGGTDFFEMNLPHCLLANVVKTEMEAVGSHIQVNICAPFLQDFTIPFY
jgi:hypothetical protein